jgi:hypothetical protein
MCLLHARVYVAQLTHVLILRTRIRGLTHVFTPCTRIVY